MTDTSQLMVSAERLKNGGVWFGVSHGESLNVKQIELTKEELYLVIDCLNTLESDPGIHRTGAVGPVSAEDLGLKVSEGK